MNNGIEFLTEMGDNVDEEVVNLISFSASQASAKLKAYRMAYGAGGADDSIKPEEVHQAIESIVAEEKKVIQEWDPYGEFGYGDDRPKAFSKMLICGLILAMECLLCANALAKLWNKHFPAKLWNPNMCTRF